MDTHRKKHETARRTEIKLHRKEIIQELSKEYGLRCWYCGYVFITHQEIFIDHIQAFSQTQNNCITNLALSCSFCNQHKFYYSIENFIKYLSHVRSGQFCCSILKKMDKTLITEQEYDRLQKSFY